MAGIDARMLDMKSMLKLDQYKGEREKFLSWKWSFYVAIRVISKDLLEKLQYVETHLNKDYS